MHQLQPECFFSIRNGWSIGGCPHCKIETVLFIPPEPPNTPKQPKKKSAILIKFDGQNSSGGLERTLDLIGSFVMGIGSLAAFFVLWGGIVQCFNDDNTNSFLGPYLILSAIAIFVGALINRTLFNAMSEIIRLLKKMNGLRFSGGITQPKCFNDDFSTNCSVCSNCANVIEKPTPECPFCKSKFDV